MGKSVVWSLAVGRWQKPTALNRCARSNGWFGRSLPVASLPEMSKVGFRQRPTTHDQRPNLLSIIGKPPGSVKPGSLSQFATITSFFNKLEDLLVSHSRTPFD